MSEALVGLERILTTPIPWSYNAHIWGVTWVYCVLLPFQLYGAGFRWLTIPGTMIVAYIVIGFAEIGQEIENPFGYDPNDLALDTFTQNIIARGLSAIIARQFSLPETWVFSAQNTIMGEEGAEVMQYKGMEEVRRELAGLDRSRSASGQSGLKEKLERAIGDIVPETHLTLTSD